MARLGIRSGIRCLSSFLFSPSFPFFFFLLFSPFFFGLGQHFSFLPPQKKNYPPKKKNWAGKKFHEPIFYFKQAKKNSSKRSQFLPKTFVFPYKMLRNLPLFLCPFWVKSRSGRVQVRSREGTDALPGGSRCVPGRVQTRSRRGSTSFQKGSIFATVAGRAWFRS